MNKYRQIVISLISMWYVFTQCLLPFQSFQNLISTARKQEAKKKETEALIGGNTIDPFWWIAEDIL